MKRILMVSLILIIFTTGCQGTSAHQNNKSRQQDPMLNVSYNSAPSQQKSTQSELDRGNFGFVHYKREKGKHPQIILDQIPKIDPKELADVVTRLEITLPDVYDVGTLATDRYILIGYKSTEKNRNLVASQVRQTAYSVTPRYYDIYISDQRNVIDQIARYQDLSVQTPRINDLLQNMIKDMKSAPQGK